MLLGGVLYEYAWHISCPLLASSLCSFWSASWLWILIFFANVTINAILCGPLVCAHCGTFLRVRFRTQTPWGVDALATDKTVHRDVMTHFYVNNIQVSLGEIVSSWSVWVMQKSVSWQAQGLQKTSIYGCERMWCGLETFPVQCQKSKWIIHCWHHSLPTLTPPLLLGFQLTQRLQIETTASASGFSLLPRIITTGCVPIWWRAAIK